MATQRHGWWIIGGHNEQARYGYGSEAEAVAYCDHLNRNREINHVHHQPLGETDEAAGMTGRDDGFDLGDALRSIADCEASR